MSDLPEDEGDDVEEIDDGAARVVLRASAARWIGVLVACMVFIAFGGGIALGDRTGPVATAIGWAIVAVFAFCAAVALRQLVLPGSLIVSRETIDVIRNGKLTTFALADCSEFTAWRNPSRGVTVVVFDHSPDYSPDQTASDSASELAEQNRRLMGGSRSLSENYGLSPQALVNLLNDARAAALSDRDGRDSPES